MLSACRSAFNSLGLLLLGVLLTALPAPAQNPTPAPSASPQAKASQVSILGDVKKPGLYPWHRGLSVLELLAACDGPTVAPERTLATLVTRFGVEEVPIHLDTLLAGTDPAQNRVLLPGDTLIVALASTGGEVQVVGQIAHPGLYHVPKDGFPLITVLNEAGGVLPDADLVRAKIMRGVETQSIDLRPLLEKSPPAEDPRLLPGDVLLISARRKIAVLGAVQHSGDFMMPDDGTLTVTGALALAGGPRADADIYKIVIVRHHYGKPIERIHAGLNDQLLAGDAVIVPLNTNAGKARPQLIAGAAQGVTP